MLVLALQTKIFETDYCWIVHLYRFWICCSSVFAKLLENNIFGFSVVFSNESFQNSIFEVEYLGNGLADFNDFGFIWQDFGRPFRWNQLGLACSSPLNMKTCKNRMFKFLFVNQRLFNELVFIKISYYFFKIRKRTKKYKFLNLHGLSTESFLAIHLAVSRRSSYKNV